MKIFVNPKNYTPFDYSAYLERGDEIPKPKNAKYHVGQVVLLKDRRELAVILGCIDENSDGTVRLDLCGITETDTFRPAKKADLKDKTIFCVEKLRAECEGKIVHYDWKTYELTIDGELISNNRDIVSDTKNYLIEKESSWKES